MGGDPEQLWARGTLPMYYALQRYWSDHPRVDQIAASYFKISSRYTPPPNEDGTPATPAIDWSLLDDPNAFGGHGVPGAPVKPRQLRSIDDELAERFPQYGAR